MGRISVPLNGDVWEMVRCGSGGGGGGLIEHPVYVRFLSKKSDLHSFFGWAVLDHRYVVRLTLFCE